MDNTDIAIAVDSEGNYFRVLVARKFDALADVTPIDKDTFDDIGEKHREQVADLKEFYTLFDHKGNVLSEPCGEEDDDCHLRESSNALKNAKETLRTLGFTISLNRDTGEYRVNPVGGNESTAYYTDDLEDAVNTAKHWK